MAKTFSLQVITPERTVFKGEVEMLIARATDGDLGILPGHAPLIASLAIWPLRVLTAGGEILLSVCGGFLEVLPHQATVLASCAELPEEIDVKRALAAKERAESRLKGDRAGIDVLRAELALKRAIARLKVAETVRQRSHG